MYRRPPQSATTDFEDEPGAAAGKAALKQLLAKLDA
jgi:hypothetical protein